MANNKAQLVDCCGTSGCEFAGLTKPVRPGRVDLVSPHVLVCWRSAAVDGSTIYALEVKREKRRAWGIMSVIPGMKKAKARVRTLFFGWGKALTCTDKRTRT